MLQVTRHVWDQAAGKSVAQSEVLEVPIKAGWKAGTKITYAGEQDTGEKARGWRQHLRHTAALGPIAVLWVVGSQCCDVLYQGTAVVQAVVDRQP